MKFLISTALLLPLFTLLSFTAAQAQSATSARPNQANAKVSKAAAETVRFKTSAVCDMCKARLEKSLAYEKGVQSATLDVPTQILTVKYRTDKTDVAALRQAVQKTGYDADDQVAETRAYDRLPDCCKKTNAVHSDGEKH